MPKVSVLMPSFNAANYIRASIDSVLKQTWENIELIIVDDGSTDNSAEIASAYASERVKVFRQENGGACVARNKAFELSSGNYIQYLDADDLIAPDKIERQVKALTDKSDQTIAFCRWQEFLKDTTDSRPFDLYIYKDYDRPLQLLIDMWCKREMISPAAWLAPRNLIKETGNWTENLEVNQDGEFFCRVLLNTDFVLHTPSVCYYRKGNVNSVSNSRFKFGKVKSLLESYLLYEKYVEKYMNEEGVRRGLANNYYYFIYTYYHVYPKLVKVAKQRADALNLKPVWKISGGKNFKKLSRLLGYYNVLKIRKMLYDMGALRKSSS